MKLPSVSFADIEIKLRGQPKWTPEDVRKAIEAMAVGNFADAGAQALAGSVVIDPPELEPKPLTFKMKAPLEEGLQWFTVRADRVVPEGRRWTLSFAGSNHARWIREGKYTGAEIHERIHGRRSGAAKRAELRRLGVLGRSRRRGRVRP